MPASSPISADVSRTRIAPAVRVAITILLALEGVYFLWFGFGLARLVRGAQNASAGDALPPAFWGNMLSAALCVFAAAAYFVNLGGCRRWVAPPAIAALAYGVWGVWTGYPLVTSLSSAFAGDAVAAQVLSGFGFMAIGLLGLLRQPG